MTDKTTTVVIWIVTGIWAVNVVVGMVGLWGYRPSEGINGIFTIFVGGAFTARAVAKGKSDDRDGEK